MPLKASNNGVNALDNTDLALLGELQEDARLTLAELGRRVGLSAPAVTDRLRRLEASDVIAAHRTQGRAEAPGLPPTSIVRIRPSPRQLHKVAELARETTEVVECHRITGEDCFFIKAHVRDVHHLEELIDRFTPYGQTTTSIVQSSPVPRRGVALEV